ncbi:hypothetical protein [Flavobacterium limi]|uniref:DUF4595 domain-containing protein n=1 Tax=Flavobacterium limi TaxID=2045105 RepID=A0ABQ1TZS7_9FLAO|nr:hypothetical protein [Flavobacterium limi]GGF06975.1 hypothetical protein GCM10011518_15300 [Flavobacterium limi]
MKKIICLLIVVILAITSCSSNDEQSNPVTITPPALVKQITSIKDGKEYVEKITYNGNKIVSRVGSDNYTINYTYTGNYITKIEYINANGVLEKTNEYVYLEGRLSSLFEIEPGSSYKYETTYGYVVNGPVRYFHYSIDINTGQKKSLYSGEYIFTNGNLVKNEAYGNKTIVYEYDGKFNPWRNVLGLNFLLDEDYSATNFTKVTTTNNSGNTSISTYTHKYNTSAYPTETARTISDGISTSTETIKIGY